VGQLTSHANASPSSKGKSKAKVDHPMDEGEEEDEDEGAGSDEEEEDDEVRNTSRVLFSRLQIKANRPCICRTKKPSKRSTLPSSLAGAPVALGSITPPKRLSPKPGSREMRRKMILKTIAMLR
jgi:hypothetical protein